MIEKVVLTTTRDAHSVMKVALHDRLSVSQLRNYCTLQVVSVKAKRQEPHLALLSPYVVLASALFSSTPFRAALASRPACPVLAPCASSGCIANRLTWGTQTMPLIHTRNPQRIKIDLREPNAAVDAPECRRWRIDESCSHVTEKGFRRASDSRESFAFKSGKAFQLKIFCCWQSFRWVQRVRRARTLRRDLATCRRTAARSRLRFSTLRNITTISTSTGRRW